MPTTQFPHPFSCLLFYDLLHVSPSRHVRNCTFLAIIHFGAGWAGPCWLPEDLSRSCLRDLDCCFGP